MIQARCHSEWPSRGLSSGTPDLNRLACSGIGGDHFMRMVPQDPMPGDVAWTLPDIAAVIFLCYVVDHFGAFYEFM